MLELDADSDVVNQHDKIIPDLIEVYDSDLDSVSSGNSFEAEADEFDDFEMYENEIEYNVPDPKARPKSTPITILVPNTIGCCQSRKLLKVLLDTGSEVTLISHSVIPKAAIPKTMSDSRTVRTIAGTLTSNQCIRLRDIRLPEFDKNRRIDELKCLIYDQPCRYDMILGSDFLAKTKMNISYEHKNVNWFGNTIPLRNPRDFTTNDLKDLIECFETQVDDEAVGDEWMDSYVTQILDAKYEKLDIDAFIKTQSHLNESQRAELKALIEKHSKLFDGTLGVYPHKKVHIEL